MTHPLAQRSGRRRLALLVITALAGAQAAWADPFVTALAEATAGRHGSAAAGFHALAQEGDAAAAHNLALLFLTGQGVPRNLSEAAFWAWQARLGGVTRAGLLLDRVMPQLDKPHRQALAARLEAALTPQAAAGDGAAMLALAVVLVHVRPTPDPVQAHGWQSIAAALDVPGALAAREAGWQALDPAGRARAEAQAMAAFQDWCRGRDRAAPPACAVVVQP